MDRDLDAYLSRGGTITKCPEAHKPLTNGKRKEPRKDKDELCKQCPNRKSCKGPCPPIRWIDGNVELQEKILSDPCDDRHCAENYNTVLAQIIDKVNQNNNNIILQIRSIRNERIRVIASLLHADIPVRRISTYVRLSKSQIYRLIGTDGTPETPQS